MEILHRIGASVATLLIAATTAVHTQDSSANDGQLKRLMAPTPSQLTPESKGQVSIDGSLGVNQVDRAMHANYEGVDDPPETDGEDVTVEDDEC